MSTNHPRDTEPGAKKGATPDVTQQWPSRSAMISSTVWLGVFALLPWLGMPRANLLSGPALMSLIAALSLLVAVSWGLLYPPALLSSTAALAVLAALGWIAKHLLPLMPRYSPLVVGFGFMDLLFIVAYRWPLYDRRLGLFWWMLVTFVVFGLTSACAGLSASIWLPSLLPTGVKAVFARVMSDPPFWDFMSPIFLVLVLSYVVIVVGWTWLSMPTWLNSVAPPLWFLVLVASERMKLTSSIAIPLWLLLLAVTAWGAMFLKRLRIKTSRS